MDMDEALAHLAVNLAKVNAAHCTPTAMCGYTAFSCATIAFILVDGNLHHRALRKRAGVIYEVWGGFQRGLPVDLILDVGQQLAANSGFTLQVAGHTLIP
jgi:hypothetical protein